MLLFSLKGLTFTIHAWSVTPLRSDFQLGMLLLPFYDLFLVKQCFLKVCNIGKMFL